MSVDIKRSSSGTAAPARQILGTMLISFAKSRLPVANKPKTRTHRRVFLSVAPIPFAPLVDTHAFQPPPPPYSAHADDSGDFLRVPHNSPEATPADGRIQRAATVGYTRAVGLGLEGVERGDGARFDGLGRVSGGFRGTVGEEGLQRMLTQRRRTRPIEQPTKEQDVFYEPCDPMARRRTRRRSVASATPGRGTISSELKRAASVERRGSRAGATGGWRV